MAQLAPKAYGHTPTSVKIDIPRGVTDGVPGDWTGINSIDLYIKTGAGAFVLHTAGYTTDTIQTVACTPGVLYQPRFVYHLADLTDETVDGGPFYCAPATPPDQIPSSVSHFAATFVRPTVVGGINYYLHYRKVGAASWSGLLYTGPTLTLETLEDDTEYEFYDLVGGNSAVTQGNTQTFQTMVDPAGQPTRCCPVGWTWDQTAGECIPTPWVPTTPDPPILVEQVCGEGITVQSPASWPAGTTYMLLRKVGKEGLLADDWLNTSEVYIDALGKTPYTHEYQVAACNAYGCSPWSAALTVQTHVTDITLTLEAPDADDPAKGTIRFLIQKSGAGVLHSSFPIMVTVNGVSYGPVHQSEADSNQFYFDYNTVNGRTSGPVVFGASAKNEDGCQTIPVTLTLDIDNTLHYSTTYKGILRDSENGEDIKRAFVWVRLNPKLNDNTDKYIELYVVSPRPAVADWKDAVAMEELLATCQPWKNGRSALVTGARVVEGGTYEDTDDTMLLVIVERPIERWLEYPLDAEEGYKIRNISAGENHIYTRGPAKILSFLDEVVELVDLTNYGLEDATDAAYVSDSEVHVIKGNRLYIVDRDADEKTLAVVPIDSSGTDESGTIFSVEVVDGKAVWIFTDSFHTRVYSYEAGKPKQLFSIEHPATLSFSRKDLLLVACGHILYLWDGEDLLEAKIHNETITGAQILDDDETIAFEDSEGDLYTLGNSASEGTLPFEGYARTRFQGANSSPRGVAAGDDNSLYIQDSSGVFTPVVVPVGLFTASSTVTALERHILEIVPGTGNPLNGGTEPVEEESLIGLINDPTDGAFLFQYQTTRPGDYSYRAQGVEEVAFWEN